ncbi:NucA/NucB deoxyribonuclease domain-containing protein [Desmospora profundinema]|uniref:Deoxyribonuclease NucA/NucB domain-containing protein n=1 Tax=Desmospora profundinema TaxID=1571184 RepID=A0ABU1IH21_9BACL|nr:NucA/NucB deoxyribonuclease domain-containing protein [Desmospora profundinema]MDR6224075.1 hypothetical protein [Desmospora profundinema]
MQTKRPFWKRSLFSSLFVLILLWTTTVEIADATPTAGGGQAQTEKGGFYWLPNDPEKVDEITQIFKEGQSIEELGLKPGKIQKRKGFKSLEEMRAADEKSTATYDANPGAPEMTTQGWQPPRFEYDYIRSVDECINNPASNTEEGWIKNHYAYCWTDIATYQIPRRCFLGICFYDGVQIRFTVLGYGSNHDRKARFTYFIDDILVTNPRLNGAKLKVDLLCEPKVNPGDCKPNPITPAEERTIAEWRNQHVGYKDFLSDAPDATDFNPDRIGYMEFWPQLTIKDPPRKFTRTIDGPKQTVRFDSATYMFAFPDQYFRHGAIFSKTNAVLNVPINDPQFSVLREAGEHWKHAMENPEETKPTVLGKKIPGALGDRPLTRMYTRRHPDEYAANRNKTRATCDREFRDEDRTGKQCDEFPFASTWEGSSTNGMDWFSVKLISKEANEAAGSWLGSWYAYDRILDGDYFYVRVRE